MSYSGLLYITVLRAKELRNASSSAQTPHVTITIGTSTERTNSSANAQTPEWNQTLQFPLNPSNQQQAHIVVSVPFVEPAIGEAWIPLSELISHAHQQRWYAIHDVTDKNYSTGIIQLEVVHDSSYQGPKQAAPMPTSTTAQQQLQQLPPSYAHATGVSQQRANGPQTGSQVQQQTYQPTYAQPPQQPTYAQPPQPSGYPGQVYQQQQIQPQYQPSYQGPPPAYAPHAQPQYQPPQYQQAPYQYQQPPQQPVYQPIVYQQAPPQPVVIQQAPPSTVVVQNPPTRTVVVEQRQTNVVVRPTPSIGIGAVGTGLVAGAVLGSLFGGHGHHHHHHHGWGGHHHHHRHHHW